MDGFLTSSASYSFNSFHRLFKWAAGSIPPDPPLSPPAPSMTYRIIWKKEMGWGRMKSWKEDTGRNRRRKGKKKIELEVRRKGKKKIELEVRRTMGAVLSRNRWEKQFWTHADTSWTNWHFKFDPLHTARVPAAHPLPHSLILHPHIPYLRM